VHGRDLEMLISQFKFLDEELPFDPRSCVNGLDGKAMVWRDNHMLVVICALSSSLFS
jgi:hypothetical protein